MSAPQDGFAASMLEDHPAPALVASAGGTVRWTNAAARRWLADADGALPASLEAIGLTGDWVSSTPAHTLDADVVPGGAAAVRCRIAAGALTGGQRLITLTPVADLEQEARRAQTLAEQLDLAREFGRLGVWERDVRTLSGHWDRHVFGFWGLDASAGTPDYEAAMRAILDEDRAGLDQAFRDSIRRAGTYDHRYRVRRPDGSVRWLHSQWVVRDGADGRPERALGIMVDDTEAWERATLIARGVGLGTWEYDLRTGESFWDEQMWRVRGLPPRAQAPSPEERLALVHPDDRETARAMFERTQSTSLPVDYEFRVRWPDGSWHWIASRSIAQSDGEGRPQRRIGVNWDITEARSALAEREEKLAAQREVQAKAQFLSRMSHELRTPLNAVLGFTQLLMAEDATSDAATRAHRLDHIRSAGQHLLSLIDDVLDLSRLEGGEVAIKLEPAALQPMVAVLLPMLEPLARRHGVVLEAGPLDAAPLADPTRLRQVLLNLLTNAVKYNRPGGRARIEAGAVGGVVVLRVSDTGHGMTPAQMSQLFEPFNRLGAERTDVEGTGIGLAIVKALVERMGGTVHVESTVDRGSRFELRLRAGGPVQPAAVEFASPRTMALAATAGRVGRGGTLLYIEDNPVNTLIVGELVAQRRDLKLHSAATGQEGLALAQDLKPDLILLDMQLPDINGSEVFALLQADPRTAHIPCIALSANAMPSDIDTALRAGFADYWTKPLDFRSFTTSIEAMFGPAP